MISNVTNQTFLVFPVKEAGRQFEDLSGDFIQEQLTDAQALGILENAKAKGDDLSDEYTLDELLAEFNGDIQGRFNSDNYYIYKLKTNVQ